MTRKPTPTAPEQIADLYGRTTDAFIRAATEKLELARAAGDHDALVKEHIKIEVMRAARGLYDRAHTRVTGEPAWPPEAP